MEIENLVTFLFFSQNPILLNQKLLDQILHIISSYKFQTKKNFNKSHSIIHHLFTMKTL